MSELTRMVSAPPRKSFIVGIAAVLIVGVASWYAGQFIPRLGSVTVAILFGILVGNLLLPGNTGARGIAFAEKQLLPLAIVMLGVELQLSMLVSLGGAALLVILASIATSIVVSVRLGQLFGFSQDFSLLMGAGNGICGSSAVAATSIAIQAEETDTGISISIVNLLGTIGIFVMPALFHLLSLSDVQGGLLVGGTLQAFGQAVAAGFSINEHVGNIATVVKMGRVLMLGPVVLMIGYWIQSQTRSQENQHVPVRPPRFIFGFFLLSIAASADILSQGTITTVATVGNFLLILAMVAIGIRIRFSTLLRSGVRSLLFGGLIASVQIIVTLITIMLIA